MDADGPGAEELPPRLPELLRDPDEAMFSKGEEGDAVSDVREAEVHERSAGGRVEAVRRSHPPPDFRTEIPFEDLFSCAYFPVLFLVGEIGEFALLVDIEDTACLVHVLVAIPVLGDDPTVLRQPSHIFQEIRSGGVGAELRVVIVGNDADDRFDAVSVEDSFERMKRVPVHRGADIIQSEKIASAERGLPHRGSLSCL